MARVRILEGRGLERSREVLPDTEEVCARRRLVLGVGGWWQCDSRAGFVNDAEKANLNLLRFVYEQ